MTTKWLVIEYFCSIFGIFVLNYINFYWAPSLSQHRGCNSTRIDALNGLGAFIRKRSNWSAEFDKMNVKSNEKKNDKIKRTNAFLRIVGRYFIAGSAGTDWIALIIFAMVLTASVYLRTWILSCEFQQKIYNKIREFRSVSATPGELHVASICLSIHRTKRTWSTIFTV